MQFKKGPGKGIQGWGLVGARGGAAGVQREGEKRRGVGKWERGRKIKRFVDKPKCIQKPETN